jgi:hypothetical protein
VSKRERCGEIGGSIKAIYFGRDTFFGSFYFAPSVGLFFFALPEDIRRGRLGTKEERNGRKKRERCDINSNK